MTAPLLVGHDVAADDVGGALVEGVAPSLILANFLLVGVTT